MQEIWKHYHLPYFLEPLSFFCFWSAHKLNYFCLILRFSFENIEKFVYKRCQYFMCVITFYVKTLLSFDRKYDSTLLSYCEYCGQKIKQWRLLQSRLLVILWAMSRCNLIWFDITRSKPDSDCSNRKRVALILFSLSRLFLYTHGWPLQGLREL